MKAGFAGVLASAGCLLALAPAARAQGIDETCVLALAKFDPSTINIAFPDDSALYYQGGFALPPGVRVRISGRFPHARYMSFNVYDPALRPVDGLTDIAIKPDKGSHNPFLRGASRRYAHRSYTVFIEGGDPPKSRPANTIYAGASNPAGLFIYRIYVPDRGSSETGDVGLPTATLEAAGAQAPPQSACANFVKPGVTGINELLANASPPAELPLPSGSNPPVWRRFVNLLSSLAVNSFGSPDPGGVDLDKYGGSGGFLSNRDNAYVSAPLNRNLGPIVVTRLRAPTFADTRAGVRKMPGGQLRYWSMCMNDPITQRFTGCVNDDRAVRTRGGYATVVVSTPARRPGTATAKCGVNWLPWGVNTRGLLIYRNMLPDPRFAQAIQRAKVDHEKATMGSYLPVSRYYADAASYAKAVGCPGSAKAQKHLSSFR